MQALRFLVAVVLMIAVMVVTNILLPPPQPEPQLTADTTALPTATGEAGSVPPVARGASEPGAVAGQDPAAGTGATAAVPGITAATTTPDLARAASGDTVVVESELYRYAFSTLGSALVSAQILQHPSLAADADGRPAELVPAGAHALLDFHLRVDNRDIDLSQLTFRAEPAAGVRLGETGTAQLRMVHEDVASGLVIELDYSFDATRYFFDVRGAVRGIGERPAQLLMGLGPQLAVNEADSAEDVRTRGYVLNNPSGDGITAVPLRKLEGERIEEGPLSWVAIKSKYFVAGLLKASENSRDFGGVIATPSPQGADLRVTLAPGADGRFAFRMYAGPQEQGQLSAAGTDFENVNPFGWKFFRWFLQPVGQAVTWALYQLHDLFGIGYGWVLILFGVIVRVLLWPLNATAMRSQMKNMEIQPKLKEIQTRYKNEPEKLQKEMLRLYKEEKFNPMAGCLPMLAPLPILLTLFFVFQNTIAFRGVEFLWLPDLSQKDPLYILPVVLGASMFAISWFSMKTTAQDNPQAKMMLYFMPIFMTVIFLNFASGLNLYYAAQNLASIPQQLQITAERKRILAQKRT